MQWIVEPWARMQWRSAAMDATCISAACASRLPDDRRARRAPTPTRASRAATAFLQRAPGLLGLPIIGGQQRTMRHQLRQSSASVLYLRNQSLSFSEIGTLDARAASGRDDGCRASCVDWYGNSRPLFIRDRICADGLRDRRGALSSATASSRRGASTSLPLTDFVQDRPEVAEEGLGVFAHREMPEAFHHRELGARECAPPLLRYRAATPSSRTRR